MTLNFGLYKHAQLMVREMQVVQLNFCLNHCHLFAKQGGISSSKKKKCDKHQKGDAMSQIKYF